jgi:hypothetical protein
MHVGVGVKYEKNYPRADGQSSGGNILTLTDFRLAIFKLIGFGWCGKKC